LDTQTRLILRAWIEAIIYHAVTRLPLHKQRSFMLEQIGSLERDFGVHIHVTEDLLIEIDYLARHNPDAS
jgi:hypothetical protein